MVSVVARKVFHGFRRWLINGVRGGKERCLWFPSLVVYGCRLLQDHGCLSDGNRLKKTPGRF